MVNSIERPFDFLNSLKGEKVNVLIKGDVVISGELIAFDAHINLVLTSEKGSEFICGSNVISVVDYEMEVEKNE